MNGHDHHLDNTYSLNDCHKQSQSGGKGVNDSFMRTAQHVPPFQSKGNKAMTYPSGTYFELDESNYQQECSFTPTVTKLSPTTPLGNLSDAGFGVDPDVFPNHSFQTAAQFFRVRM